MDTCKWLTWITLEMWQEGDRRQVGTKKKNKVKHVCERVLLRQTIPWHLMKKVLPGHIQ